MNLDLRKILVFGAQFLLLFLVLLCFYPSIVPQYQSVVFDLVNVMVQNLSPPLRIEAVPGGYWKVNVDESPPRPAWFFTMGGDEFSELVFLSLVILPALLLSTPVRILERLRLLAWGLILLFLVHVLSVTACIFALGKLCHEGSGLFCANLSGILSPGGELSAFALWTLLTWRHWFRAIVPATSTRAERKAARREG